MVKANTGIITESMKRIIFILLFFASLHAAAQKIKYFDARYSDTANNIFFRRNTSIDHLSFSYDFPNRKTMAVFFKKEKNNTNHSYGDEFYNLNFIGDTYIFEKKYGAFLLPEKKIQDVLNKKCSAFFYLTLIALPDSVKINLRSTCISNNDEDRIFTKVEVWAAYKYGVKQLEKRVQAALDANSFSGETSIPDSVVIFRVKVPAKDSCLQDIELLYGQKSSFTKIVAEELLASCGWIPRLAGGRPVHAYIKIYARLNKDRSISLAYPE
jgi:hypothetical protein